MTRLRPQIRVGTAAQWSSRNPVLRRGEFGWTTDTGVLKIGDGFTPYNSLSAANSPASGSLGWIAYATGSGVTAQDKTDIATAVRAELNPDLTVVNDGVKNASLLIPHTTNL